MHARRTVVGLAMIAVLVAGSLPVAAGPPGSELITARLYEAVDRGELSPDLRGGIFGFPDPAVRELAVRSLAVAANPRDVANLARFLRDRDLSVQHAVMVAAGRTGPSAAPLVRSVLRSPSALVRHGAVWAATQMGDAMAREVVDALGRERDGGVLEIGLANLWRLPAGTWEALARSHAASDDPLLRRAAAYSLARAGGPGDRQALARLARDPEPVIRATAIRGLGRGGPQDGDIPLLAAGLADPDWRVRAAACGVLAGGGPSLPEAARAALLEGAGQAEHPQLRIAAVRALGAHDEVDDGGLLRRLLEGPGPWPASEALAALVRRGSGGSAALVRDWLGSTEAWRRRAAARASAHLQGEAAASVASTVLGADDGVVLAWLEASAAADRLPPRKVLLGLLERPDPAVRAQALDLLLARGEGLAVDRLLELARRWSGDELPDARATAYRRALALAPAAERPEILRLASGDPDWSVQARAVWTARRLGMEATLAPRERRHGLKWYRDLVAWSRQDHWLDLVTVRGTLRIRLDSAIAPITAREIWELAESGFYDGLTFHRVVPNFVVQGGDPRGDGWGGPGFVLPDEISLEPFDSFRVGIATSGPDTGGCQLFVTLLPADHLTGRYTNLGEVVRGREVLERLQVGDVIRKVVTATGEEPPPPVPVLTGELRWSDLATLPGWKKEHDGYVPDGGALSQLRRAAGTYDVVVVLGSWCSDSEREVPRLVKVLEAVGGDRFRLHLVGVDRTLVVEDPAVPASLLAGGRAERVPTIFVLDENGQELGRVVETAEAPLEELLVEFVAPVEGR